MVSAFGVHFHLRSLTVSPETCLGSLRSSEVFQGSLFDPLPSPKSKTDSEATIKGCLRNCYGVSSSPQRRFQACGRLMKFADKAAVLTDGVELCGAFCVWLTKDAREKLWLSGRWVSATWDTEELTTKRDGILEKDLLKARITLS